MVPRINFRASKLPDYLHPQQSPPPTVVPAAYFVAGTVTCLTV
jgi:hypothetical protein